MKSFELLKTKFLSYDLPTATSALKQLILTLIGKLKFRRFKSLDIIFLKMHSYAQKAHFNDHTFLDLFRYSDLSIH